MGGAVQDPDVVSETLQDLKTLKNKKQEKNAAICDVEMCVC